MKISILPDFPETLDDTMVSAFRSCPMYWYYGYLRNLRPVEGKDAIDLVAGGAYAAGLEYARKQFFGGSELSRSEIIHQAQLVAIRHWGDAPLYADKPKALPNVLLAIESYFHHWGIHTDPLQPVMFEGKDGKPAPAVEFSFALPIGVDHPVTGQPILYTGKLDMLTLRNGGIWIMDDKTCSGFGPTWLNSWDMRSQFTGYTWAAQESGLSPVGVILRGCAFLPTRTEFMETFTFRPQWRVDEWLEDTRSTIRSMIEAWQIATFRQAQGSACNAFNRPCRFNSLCTTRTPEAWIPGNYQVKVWNPLTEEV